MDTLQTYERLIPIVNAMDKSVTCQSVTDNGGGFYTFASKYTKWAIAGYVITIGLVDYEITEVVCNVSIKVKGASLPTVLTFDLYPPIFKHGTVNKIAQELNMKPKLSDRMPLIALIETVDEGLHFNEEDTVDVDADCRLLFLTPCDFANWDQLKGDTTAVRPMRNLAREFVESVTKSQFVGVMDSVGNVRNYNLIGNQGENGSVNNLFNEPLSGVQLRVTIPFLKECFCCNIPTLDQRCAPGYVYDEDGNVLAVLYSNETYTVIPSGGNVNIIDQDDNIIDTIAAPGEYQVTVFSGVRDTIDSNVTTIIDNII